MTKQRIHPGKFSVIGNLRKVRIFPRLLLSFVSLILIAVTCITLISFRTYANEIESEAQDYLSLLVSNVAMKIREQLSQAELDARGFYSDPGLLRALSDNENEELDAASRENNTLLVEHALNALKSWQKDYTSIHFITPTRQYAMMDESGYRRGGVVKRLSSFYDSPFYLEALKRRGYPVWIDATRRTDVFSATSKACTVSAIASAFAWLFTARQAIQRVFWAFSCSILMSTCLLKRSRAMKHTMTEIHL